MTRCLNERALVRVYFKDGTAAEHSHLRWCADCAEAYDRLVDDLEAIHETLASVSPAPLAAAHAVPWRRAWVPLAALALAVIAIVVGVLWRQPPAPIQVAAETRSVSAFGRDIASALFPGAGIDTVAEFGSDAPYLYAALEAGRPCSEDAFVNGECSDQVSALMFGAD